MPQPFPRLRTPIGELVLTASDTALTGVFFPTSRRGPAPTHQAGWVEVTEGPAAALVARARAMRQRSEEDTSELHAQSKIVCHLLPEKKKPVERIKPKGNLGTRNQWM